MPAFNPYLPSWEYVPDGEPRVFGDRVYVYGSHDLFGSSVYCEGDYVCWSAPTSDLSAWRYEGVIYRREQDPDGARGYLYAPDCVQGADGRYYLYYAISGVPRIAVAVCDEPAGTYQFYGHVHYPDGRLWGEVQGDPNNFDPGVLVDDDGRVYVYTGFAPKGDKLAARLHEGGLEAEGGYGVEVMQDMLTIRGDTVMTIPGIRRAVGTPYDGHAFFEASSPRKIRGRYYLIWSSVLSHELCYATADKPLGPYTFGGTIVSISDIGLVDPAHARNYRGNTHGGLVEIGGQWYIFYHRHTNRTAFSRQACAEPVTILPDGSIPQVEITSCGLNGGPLPGSGCYEARIACNLSSKEGIVDFARTSSYEGHPYFTQSGTDRMGAGDQYIANLQDGAWCGFKYFAFDAQRSLTLTLRGDGEGHLIVSHDRDAAPVAVVPVTPSTVWHSIMADFHPQQGTQPLYFEYRGTGSVDFAALVMA